jgi:Zn-dependent peptidase ImmA (M78 family)
MTQLEDEDIEEAARRLRIRLGIDDQLRPDMITVIIKLKDHGLIKNYQRVRDAEMPRDEAFFDSREQILYLRESTFCAANAMFKYPEKDRRRARYTIAHEIGHVLLGHDGVRYRGASGGPAKKLDGRVNRQERDAERFAAAFLAPAHLA